MRKTGKALYFDNLIRFTSYLDLAPRNPVVFCHGLLGFDTVKVGPIYPLHVSHWRGIKEVLEANGVEVLITRVPATSSIEERAKVLEKTISEIYPGRSVHLIGHSMGGLDSRYVVTHLKKRKFKVLSVTTLATPHRGSSFADHFIATIGRERLPSVISLLELLPNGGGDGRAFDSLTIESMRKFNEMTPDVKGVQYFSWGAETATPGLFDPFRWPHSVMLEKEGNNDGLVSVESAKWGTYLGTLQDVNHLDLIGWINNTRYKWAEWTGKEIKFKPATFYLGVTDHLAKAVEGQSPNELEEQADQDRSPHQQKNKALPTSCPSPIANGHSVGEIQSEDALGTDCRNEVDSVQFISPIDDDESNEPLIKGSQRGVAGVGDSKGAEGVKDPDHREARPKPNIPGIVIKEIEESRVR